MKRFALLLLLISYGVHAQYIDFIAPKRTDFSAGYQAILTRCSAVAGCLPPSYSQQIAQNALYNSLPSGLDVFYVGATDGNVTFASINWITPASNTITAVSTPTFTKNQGFYGDGTASYYNTNWLPSNGPNNVQNSGSLFAYVINNAVGNNSMASVGSVGSSVISLILPRTATNNIDYRINQSSATSDIFATTNSAGFKHVQRTGASVVRLWLDGVLTTTNTRSSGGRPSNNLYIEALNNAGTAGFFSTRGVAIAGAGASLSGNEAALYTAIQTYLTSINVWGNTSIPMGSTGIKFNN